MMNSKFTKNLPKVDSPIFLHKSKILEKISLNQVVIIVGPTGCGKSTQIPQYLLNSGITKNGIIACLHPRCIAAITLADRVSHEIGTRLGTLVGYRVRFLSAYDDSTKILYMTTGYMLRLLQNKTGIDNFSAIIIDEAHERSLQNDIMMGLMKIIMRANKHVKLIIMSATLNIKEIEQYYPGSVTIKIKEFEDRVHVIYRPLKDVKYIFAIKDVVNEILQSSKSGHILVFLPSEEKVRKCKKMLRDLRKPIVLCFYSAMDYDDKMMIFQEFGWRRKVILATNIAETSLTIAGVDFVIDAGYVKRVHYDHETRVEKWVTERISVAEANQRKGRTGRTGFGTCYRLFDNPDEEKLAGFSMFQDSSLDQEVVNLLSNIVKTEAVKDFKPMTRYPDPEIKNINLGAIILMLKSIGIKDIDSFPFIISPDPKVIALNIAHLKEQLLLTSDGTITNMGKEVAQLPLDPIMGKVAFIGSQLSCRREIFIIIALSSVLNIFQNPTSKESKLCHRQFHSDHGDLFTLLNVYETASKYGFSRNWCKENNLNYSCLKYATMIENQLNSSLPWSKKREADLSRSKENQIKKAFLSGFYNNIAYPVDKTYQTCDFKTVTVHVGSCLIDCKDVIMGTTMLQSATSKDLVMRNCVTINEDMLKAFVPEKYKIKNNIWKEILRKITAKEKKVEETII